MKVEEFLETKKFPGRIIFSKVWGSHSHNTALPDSDYDFLVVYAAPVLDMVSLNHPPDTIKNSEGEKPDFQAYEVRKFAELLLKGNPAMVETLCTNRNVFESPEWQVLKEHRKRFLTQRSVKQYLGYAQTQLEKLAKHGGEAGLHAKGGKYSEKWAYHLVRLLWDARRIAKGEEPVVWKDGYERDLLMGIRERRINKEGVERNAQVLLDEIERLKPWKVPPEPDREFLNQWVLGIRLNDFRRLGEVEETEHGKLMKQS